jgi:hypothetical protein
VYNQCLLDIIRYNDINVSDYLLQDKSTSHENPMFVEISFIGKLECIRTCHGEKSAIYAAWNFYYKLYLQTQEMCRCCNYSRFRPTCFPSQVKHVG